MAACAAAEIGRRYGVPTHGYLGLSDSNVVDVQSGFESALGIILAALSGVNIVSGPGMLACENCQSLEKLVIDNEICGAALRLVEGVSFEAGFLATDVIEKVGPGGHFLAERHTRENLMMERFMPSDIVSRLTPSSWRKEGSKNTNERARETVDKLLDEHMTKSLPEEAESQLNRVFGQILTRHGVSKSQIPPVI